MDYGKIDAALAHVLEDVRDPEIKVLEVFIHYESDIGDIGIDENLFWFLVRISDNLSLSIGETLIGRRVSHVFTVLLSKNEISKLSEMDAVKKISFSQTLRMIDMEQDDYPEVSAEGEL